MNIIEFDEHQYSKCLLPSVPLVLSLISNSNTFRLVMIIKVFKRRLQGATVRDGTQKG